MSEMELHVLRESIDLLILKALTAEQRHGYGVAEWIERATRSTVVLEEGTLYPALHRLARRKLVRAWWGVSENNRRAKYYELTAAGRQYLETQLSTWHRHSSAIGRALAIPHA